MLNDLILGTAGHIDHGKTALIAALTGTDTDRLPEEKRRGITIEPGYAYLELPPFRLGIVDVPGHEKFVRQMVAGASGIDLALLVVAADDSVMPQTREHLDILRFLSLPAGVIAITKTDLVEPDWLELVKEEVRSLVEGSFLTNAPMVETSSATGAGMHELKSALLAASRTAAESGRQTQTGLPFRMPIDRAFTMEGHGSVVTGSVISGHAEAGETLEIRPGGMTVRVRSVQNHNRASDNVHRGQRTALNLAGVGLENVGRGHEVAAPGYLQDSRLMTVDLGLLATAGRPLKNGKRVHVHVGTAECLATVRLLDRDEIRPGQSAFAQLFLSEPSVAVWNQPLIVRSESPVFTIGGGRVLVPNAAKLRSVQEIDLRMLKLLATGEPLDRASASAWFAPAFEWGARDLPATAGIPDCDQTLEVLKGNGTILEIRVTATRSVFVQQDRMEELCDRVLHVLETLHTRHPLRFKHPWFELEAAFKWLPSVRILEFAVDRLRNRQAVEAGDSTIGLTGAGPRLSRGETALLQQLVEQVRAGGLNPPGRAELMSGASKNRDSVMELLRLAGENGELVAVTDDMYFHVDAIEQARSSLRQGLSGGGLTMSEIRQILQTSRKYSVPLCEYLDSVGYTRREGEKRVLA